MVTDFYSAYDGLPCLHQRCLIHLMRDMNRAILDNPFDQELQSITVPFGALLRSIVVTVDAHGLKRQYLKRSRQRLWWHSSMHSWSATMNPMPPKPCRSVYSAIASVCSPSCNMTAIVEQQSGRERDQAYQRLPGRCRTKRQRSRADRAFGIAEHLSNLPRQKYKLLKFLLVAGTRHGCLCRATRAASAIAHRARSEGLLAALDRFASPGANRAGAQPDRPGRSDDVQARGSRRRRQSRPSRRRTQPRRRS